MTTLSLLQALVDSTHKDFGISPGFPIRASSVPSSYSYLDRLRRVDGKESKFNRIGSFTGQNGHILDRWQFEWDGGQCVFFVDCYAGFDSSCSPFGWKLAPRTNNDPWISSNQLPTSPATWESSDDGEAWSFGDSIAVFQTNPPTMVEKVCKTGIAKLKESNEILQTIPKVVKYPFVLQLFYKPGMSPVSKDSRRAFRAFAIKQLPCSHDRTAWRYILCEFNSGGEFNYKELTALPTRNDVIRLFFKIAGIPEHQNHIGTMKDAYKLLNPNASLPQAQDVRVGGSEFSLFELVKSGIRSLFNKTPGKKDQPTNISGKSIEPDFSAFPYGSKYTHLNHSSIHKELRSANSIDEFQKAISNFDSPQDAWNYNKGWLFENCKGYQPIVLSLLCGIDPQEAEIIMKQDGDGMSHYRLYQLFRFLISNYKDPVVRSYLVEANDRLFLPGKLVLTDAEKEQIIKMKDEDLCAFINSELPNFSLKASDFNAKQLISSSDVMSGNHIAWTMVHYQSLLSQAVAVGDVMFASFLLDHGADVNQRLETHISNGAIMEADPIICRIRNAEMFELFVKHGVEFYPWSGYVHEGKRDEKSGFRNNLLETLWKEAEPSPEIQNLYSVLYKYNYDAPSKLRNKELIQQYKNSGKPWKGGGEFEKWVHRNGWSMLSGDASTTR